MVIPQGPTLLELLLIGLSDSVLQGLPHKGRLKLISTPPSVAWKSVRRGNPSG